MNPLFTLLEVALPALAGTLGVTSVGLMRELLRLYQKWLAARVTPVVHVVVLGRTGSGKTALIRALTASGSDRAMGLDQVTRTEVTRTHWVGIGGPESAVWLQFVDASGEAGWFARSAARMPEMLKPEAPIVLMIVLDATSLAADLDRWSVDVLPMLPAVLLGSLADHLARVLIFVNKVDAVSTADLARVESDAALFAGHVERTISSPLGCSLHVVFGSAKSGAGLGLARDHIIRAVDAALPDRQVVTARITSAG